MRARSLAAVSLIALTAAGCATSQGVSTAAVRAADEAPLRADVNPGYEAGQVTIPTKPAKSLQQVLGQKFESSKEKKDKEQEEEDKLRIPAMQEAAQAYGARAGLAWATREINRTLEKRAAELTRTYDFQRLMIQGPNGVMVTPPVISEARDTWESFDAGKTLRVADTVYEIISQSEFSSVAPMWQSYLISDFKEPELPPDALAPRDDKERERWNDWVRQGWKKGEDQAKQIFEANLNRLNRDFIGMVRYRQLLEEGKVDPPVLAEGNLGVTGTGQDMRVNDRAVRITRDPRLVVDPGFWGASVTGKGADGKPEGPAFYVPEPTPSPERKARPSWGKSSKAKSVTSINKRTAEKKRNDDPVGTPPERTSGGTGRF